MNSQGWNKYVGCFKKEFEGCEFKEDLISACKEQEDIACVLYYHLLEHAFNWLDRPIPALKNKIPREEIENGNGDEVRKVLWRMP